MIKPPIVFMISRKLFLFIFVSSYDRFEIIFVYRLPKRWAKKYRMIWNKPTVCSQERAGMSQAAAIVKTK